MVDFVSEQAVRHALQHFKREDLPATKYQKPHFKPIKIADADFGLCLETTMSYPTYNNLVETNNESENCDVKESINPVLVDFNNTTIVNNCNSDKIDYCTCNNSVQEENEVLNLELPKTEVSNSQDIKTESTVKIHNNSNNSFDNVLHINVEKTNIVNKTQKVEENDKILEKEENVNLSNLSVLESESKDLINSKIEIQEESDKTSFDNQELESSESDVTENESSNLSTTSSSQSEKDEVVSEVQCPTEISQSKSNDVKTENVEECNNINDNETKIEEKKESQPRSESTRNFVVEQEESINKKTTTESELPDTQNSPLKR